jgi:hypothetical protein
MIIVVKNICVQVFHILCVTYSFWLFNDPALLDSSEHTLVTITITGGVLQHSGLNYKFQTQKLKVRK